MILIVIMSLTVPPAVDLAGRRTTSSLRCMLLLEGKERHPTRLTGPTRPLDPGWQPVFEVMTIRCQ